MITRVGLFLSWSCLLALAVSCSRQNPKVLTVFCAASLTEVMQEFAGNQPTSPGIEYAFGASGVLARQIALGAPADVFITADPNWLDYLEKEGALVPGTRRPLFANELVLVKPLNSRLTVRSPSDLTHVERLAMAEPMTTPAGRYAAEFLDKHHLREALASSLVSASNVRAALLLVEQSLVDAGFVYRTDALASDLVDICYAVPPGDHTPILYAAGIVHSSSEPEDAKAFLDALGSIEAASILQRYGYKLLE